LADTIHLIGPAASCSRFLLAVGADSGDAFVEMVQSAVGQGFRITADEALLEATEDDEHGGRCDDARRAEDIERALADDDVVALLAVRGGAWFSRILPRIDFSVLDRRRRRVAVFGFSELTTLVNIVGSHDRGVGVYDMGPAFLSYGLRRRAELDGVTCPDGATSVDDWVAGRLAAEFRSYLSDVAAILKGEGSTRRVTARLALGELPDRFEASFVGGNLVVLTTLVGSRFDQCVRPANRWMVLEEINEKPERIDRFLAHLTLAGFWDTCAGVLLGDFHRKQRQLSRAVVKLLKYHLPPDRAIPVLITEQVGHVWPMSPLPLHETLTLTRERDESFSFRGSVISAVRP